MNLFCFAYIFLGSACFPLGCLHLLIYFRRKELKADLFFASMSFAISFSTFLELWTFKADTLTAYLPLFKATLLVQAILWICFAWFVHFYTGSKKIWPPALITALYLIAFVINIFSPYGILFREITQISPYTMPSGGVIHLAQGPANPFRLIADIAWIIFLVYAMLAFIRFGRNQNARQAIISGTTIFLCLGIGYLHGTLIDIGIADPPYLGSFLFMPLLIVMSLSLAGDVVKSSRLSSEIKSAEARWRNLLEDVHLIVLGIDPAKNIFYVNPYFIKLTGYDSNDILGQPCSNIIPDTEKEKVAERLDKIFSGKQPVRSERQLQLITSSGEVLEVLWSNVGISSNGNPSAGMLSIGRDITNQVTAEKARDQAIRELESLKISLEAENISLKEMINEDHGFTEIIGNSNSLHYVLNKVQQVAPTDSTVLIMGETGTGKELVAQAIQQESLRSHQPFIRVNCAAIPQELVESELFGHEPGAFTNAVNLKKGKFELASGGTIFLDEISEMPLASQAKLLTVLQEKELERVGGTKTIPVDVRIISATNRDLENEVAEDRFRPDLYYRINVYPITIPPLRKRREDIPLLVNHFVSLFNKKFDKCVNEVSPHVLTAFAEYDWPGNIRELRNIVERAVVTSTGTNLELPVELKSRQYAAPSTDRSAAPNAILPLAEMEKRHILLALEKTSWRIGGMNGAAKILKINPSTLRSRIKKLGLEKP